VEDFQRQAPLSPQQDVTPSMKLHSCRSLADIINYAKQLDHLVGLNTPSTPLGLKSVKGDSYN